MARDAVRIELKSNLGKIPDQARPRLRRVLVKAAADIEGRAKTAVPVRTGNLKNSIQAQAGRHQLEREVAVGAVYGVFVEFGTHKMGARPYLTPASEAVRPAFERAVAQAVQEAAEAEKL